MSTFTDTMFDNARSSTKAWSPANRTTLSATPGSRSTSGPDVSPVGWRRPGSATGTRSRLLAGAPVEIAPVAQSIWMRGASLTMLHQPTPRTDLQRWADETTAVIHTIDTKAVLVSDPFMPAAPLLRGFGMLVLPIADLLAHDPVAGLHR